MLFLLSSGRGKYVTTAEIRCIHSPSCNGYGDIHAK